MNKPDILWSHPFLYYWLNRVPLELNNSLDIGTGRGVVGALLKVYRSPENLHGIEVFEPYVSFAKQFYSKIFVGNALEQLSFLQDKSYEMVTCFEVIEHLTKEDGKKLIKEMERVGKTVFISTPVKYFEQHEFDSNPYQRHRSLWTPKEFRQVGYKVRGFGELEFKWGAIFRVFLPGMCETCFAWKRSE
ncbi:MAG: class I SAM-dependent methyltransferase [Ignavibacteriae bacterium]|nr:class I SAM-dependent methyltransferase [Ignavibacteriota bacterium]